MCQETRMTLHWVLVMLCLVKLGSCADPVLTPATLSDSGGNSADEDSNITWASLPTYGSYSAGSVTYESSGLTPLYDFCKSFISGAVFPYGIPWDLMEKAINGTLIDDVTTNYMTYLRQFAGYGACVVIGFLFIIIFPLVGMCFCCCRCCCNNCGGKMMQRYSDTQANCKRRTFAIILFILIAFTSAGMVCVYISNDQMSIALEKFDDIVIANVDDLDTYINNTIQEVKYVVDNNFNFTKDVTFRDLDNIGYLLGIPIRTSLKTLGNFDAAINSANVLVGRVSQISSALLSVNSSLGDLETKTNILSQKLTQLKTDIDGATAACTSNCPDTSNLELGFNTSSFPDISGPVSKISSVESQNLSAVVIQAQADLDNVPERVQNDSLSTVAALKDMMNNFTGKADPLIDELTSAGDTVSGGTVQGFKNTTKTFVEAATEYDKYRWYGGVGLTSIVLLVVVLELLGLFFGTFSQDSSKLPVQRSCIGTTGGNMLMASVGFVFIFSWLLMLLTTLTFIVGSPLERFVCAPLTDSSLDDLEKLVDEKVYQFQYGSTDGYFLGQLLFNNKTINITIKGLLQDCQAGKGAYSALRLGSLFDITTLTNYSSSLNIDSEIDKIKDNVDLSSVTILTPSLISQLNDLKDSINVNFTKFREELNKTAVKADLTVLATELNNYAATLPTGTQKNLIESLANRTLEINSNELASVVAALGTLQADLDSMETSVNGTDTDVDSCLDNFNVSQTYIQTNGSSAVADEARIYANRILKVVDSYIAKVLYGLDYEIGTCEPIWTLYNSLFVTALCKYTIDTLNGFWFALGWCIFFFVPSIIFSTKLAKHYRRMKHLDDSGDDLDNMLDNKNAMQLPEVHRRGSSPVFRGNKVSHHDPKPPPYEDSW